MIQVCYIPIRVVRNKDKPVEQAVVEVVETPLELIEAKGEEVVKDDQLELEFMPTERDKPARLRVVRRHPMV